MNFKSQKILFLAGEIHRPFLRTHLTSLGAEVITSIVYRTTPLPPNNQLDQINANDWVVFFSPSHTSEIVKYLKSLTFSPHIAAIGPTTHQFLIENGFNVDVTASQPTPTSLYEGINNFKV
ncbi:hypothetical protein FF38_10306 [Lucilia cuprina]|uniref:Tetrapyrrole biosynthesis uroporphyrinogen III synthase domain-containing protein n=1 Tax=Lucilia cuprina TaxID=7375 RepID=A0A0L0CAY9_LUCCU|nr:hypothetical protein FF38_10306 [Lucilia cuprina]